ncbi:hypothetical protein B0H21DRAFT_255416 [Amylocystis lapponica]|nr:hypothetical protein B0H21DRAFT_255416 [Amylocystis lapponica]
MRVLQILLQFRLPYTLSPNWRANRTLLNQKRCNQTCTRGEVEQCISGPWGCLLQSAPATPPGNCPLRSLAPRNPPVVPLYPYTPTTTCASTSIIIGLVEQLQRTNSPRRDVQRGVRRTSPSARLPHKHEAVALPLRPHLHRARDQHRRPLETLAFMQDDVLDVLRRELSAHGLSFMECLVVRSGLVDMAPRRRRARDCSSAAARRRRGLWRQRGWLVSCWGEDGQRIPRRAEAVTRAARADLPRAGDPHGGGLGFAARDECRESYNARPGAECEGPDVHGAAHDQRCLQTRCCRGRSQMNSVASLCTI